MHLRVLGSVHLGTEVPFLLLFLEPLAPPRKFSPGFPNSSKNRWDLHCGYISYTHPLGQVGISKTLSVSSKTMVYFSVCLGFPVSLSKQSFK